LDTLKLKRILVPLIGLIAAGIAGCNGGAIDTGTIGAAAGSGDFLVMDAPIQSLVSFEALVNEIHLEGDPGGTTANLLSAPVSVEFLGLQGKLGWLASVAALPQGTYTGIRLVMQPGAYVARMQNGNLVAVNSTSDTLTVDFSAPVVVDGLGYDRFELDLDLMSSLTGNVASPPLTFTPAGTIITSTGDTEIDIDEIEGVVKSVNLVASTFTFDAFVDKDMSVPLGEVTVQVQGSTLMFQDNGMAYGSMGAMLGSMQANLTTVEVHGTLGANQVMTADKVNVEDHNAGVGSADTVKIEGLVSAIVPGTSFDLTIREIEKAESIANPVLSGMGDPGIITVSFDVNTSFFQNEYTPSNEFALAVGQEVKVKFVSFTATPFPAAVVEIDSAFPEVDGSITDTSGAPTNLTITLGAMESPVLEGLVASDATPVDVDLSGAAITLDTEDDPIIAASALWAGLDVEVEGSLGGTPAAPTLSAVGFKVRPGKISYASLSSPDEPNSTFLLGNVNVADDFGNGLDSSISNGDFIMVIDPSCVIDDGELDVTGLYALYAGLDLGTFGLSAEIRGIATAGTLEIRAYEIETTVFEAP
jgi:hypothetical protein